MDVSSLAAGLVMLQTANLQQQIAARSLKTNIAAEGSVLQLLQSPGTPGTASLSPGVGGSLDILA